MLSKKKKQYISENVPKLKIVWTQEYVESTQKAKFKFALKQFLRF